MSFAAALLALAMAFPQAGALHAQTSNLNPAYLAEMPSVEKVMSTMQAGDADETAARQMAAFTQLKQMIEDMAGSRFYRRTNGATPDELRLRQQYYTAYYNISQSKPQYRSFMAMRSYDISRQFRDEMFMKLFPPSFAAEYDKATAPERARIDAARQQRAAGEAALASQGRATPTAAPPVTAGAQPSATPAPAAKSAGSTASSAAFDKLKEGMNYYDAKEYANTISSCKAAVALDPKLADAYSCLAFGYQGSGDYPSAISTYKQRLAMGEDADLYNALGQCYRHVNKNPEAIEAFRNAIRLSPKTDTLYNAYLSMGMVYYDMDDFQNAVPALQGALRVKPQSGSAAYDLGMSLLALGQFTNALSPFQQAVKADPSDADFQYGLGEDYLEMNQDDKAVAPLREAVRLDEKYADAWSGLGEAYLGLDKISDAVAAYQEAARLKPSDDNNATLGLAYAQAGRKADALEIYKKLLTTNKKLAQDLYDQIQKSP